MIKKKFIGITGAANGIGREIAKQYVAKGWTVVGVDIDHDGLSTLEGESNGLFHSVTCDLSLPQQLDHMLSEIHENFGIPAIWFNNAGIAPIKFMHDISDEELDKTMQINFFALVKCVRYWLKKMDKVGTGCIVNIGSVAGHLSSPGLSAYAASKFALKGFTESLQSELEILKSPVKVVLVSPGFVNTDILQANNVSGFPKAFLFLTTQVEDCVRQMIDGIEAGRLEILPTFNGKAMIALQRLSPVLAKSFSRITVGARLTRK